MAIPIIPGVDQYLSEGIKSLGDTISLFTETDRKTQRAIRNMLLENPDMAQKFSDLEYKSPGTLKSLGFGSLGESVAELGPSMGVRREQELGARELAVESQELGTREFIANAVQAELARDPTISAATMGALIAKAMDVPRDAQLELEILALIPAEMQAQRAMLIMQAAERGEDVEGSIYDYARMFRAGPTSPEAAQAIGDILSHPILGPQFERIDEMLQQRENHENAKELADIRLSGQSRAGMRIPASLQNQIFELQTAKPIIDNYEMLLGDWFKLKRHERLGAVLGLGSKENQALAGNIQSLKQQLAGKLRLAVIGPGAVSELERQALLNSLGNATSFGALVRDPVYTLGQFEALKRTIMSVEKTLQDQSSNFDPMGSSGSSTGTTIQFPAFLMDELLKQDLTNEEIEAIVEAYINNRSGGQ